MCNTYYEGGPQGMHLRHGSQPERHPTIHGTPQLQPWWAAGYSFSRGHFIVNVPYDYLMPMIFQGEEMSELVKEIRGDLVSSLCLVC
jgi:[Skp1-protein]-hydroxyproline N-acetylglucosaminyltransferase